METEKDSVKTCLIVLFLLSSLAAAASRKTVWDGVYTTAQAERGKTSYHLFCAGCHGEDLSGSAQGCATRCIDGKASALKGDKILDRKELHNLFRYIRDWMPQDDMGSLDDKTCIDIVAYILQQNAFPDGASELRTDAETLRQILLVKKP
jgi:cytochrome c